MRANWGLAKLGKQQENIPRISPPPPPSPTSPPPPTPRCSSARGDYLMSRRPELHGVLRRRRRLHKCGHFYSPPLGLFQLISGVFGCVESKKQTNRKAPEAFTPRGAHTYTGTHTRARARTHTHTFYTPRKQNGE